jgi:S-adenosylmethionine:tRNA ribosyltransferase-isomerase
MKDMCPWGHEHMGTWIHGHMLPQADLRAAMHPRELSIHDVTYDLPEDRIAQQPLAERDAGKLLLFRDGVITDHRFRDLAELLPEGALVVLNDTRVINARLIFQRSTGARIEVLCLEPADGRPVEQAFAERGRSRWRCFVGNAKRWKEGEELVAGAAGVRIGAQRVAAEEIMFTWAPEELSFADVLHRLGHVPLPPYMKRPDAEADKERYNTVFARHDGSVAAPTASLHLTPAVLDALAAKRITTARLTLHVGAGTFLPVKSDTMEGHEMHREQIRVPRTALEQLTAQLGKGPIIPIGTTALRTLESIYWHGVMLLQGRAGKAVSIGQWEPYGHAVKELPTTPEALRAVRDQLATDNGHLLTGSTKLLIAPGYTFRFADALVTNFHQPQSTLLLLIAAFLGPDWRRVYHHALASEYRFLSYGDGSLLWRPAGQA